MGRVFLIGGPADGREMAASATDDVLDVDGSRYVVRRAYALDHAATDDWVGIFLPLYAALLRARFAGRVHDGALDPRPQTRTIAGFGGRGSS